MVFRKVIGREAGARKEGKEAMRKVRARTCSPTRRKQPLTSCGSKTPAGLAVTPRPGRAEGPPPAAKCASASQEPHACFTPHRPWAGGTDDMRRGAFICPQFWSKHVIYHL